MTEKGKCILAYLLGWIGGLIVLLAMKDNTRNTKFHAAQSITLSVCYCLASIVCAFLPIPFLGLALWVVYIVAIIMGIAKANKDEDPELPGIGSLAKSVFGKQIEE